MMIVNCLTWIVYAMLLRDYYVLAPNLVGHACAVYYTLSVHTHASALQQTRATFIIILFSTLVFVSGGICFISAELNNAKDVMGIVCLLILVIFYSSPLSGMMHVIQTRNAASIDMRIASASLVNGLLWTVYGLTLANGFIWGPNLLGVLFALVQLSLIYTFRRSQSSQALAVDEDHMRLNLPE